MMNSEEISAPAGYISEEDACAMVRLVADTAIHGSTVADKKRRLMDGLSALVNADVWGWALCCQTVPGGPQIYVSFVNGGFTDERFTRKMEAYSHPDMSAISKPIFDELVRTGQTVTMARHEIDPEDLGSQGEVGALWELADIGSLILSFTPLDDKSASGLGLFRRLDQPPFTPREIKMVHIVATEVPWLHQMGWPEDRGGTVPILTTRQRLVLNLLLDGLSRSDIAANMAISMHTLNSYVKAVFRHFNVSSHAELIRRFY